MRKQKKLIIALLIAAAVLLALYFAVVLPLVNREDPKTPSLTVDEGEDVLYNTRLVYENLKREDIKSIKIKNQKSDFSLVRAEPENKKSGFVISMDGQNYGLCDYDDEKISELIVSVGTVYAREKLFDGEISEETYAEYGLRAEDNPATLEVTSFAGATYTLYVGSATVTDGSYYLRLEGRDAVYVSQSAMIGNCAYSTPEQYVKPTLTSTFTTYGYYYTQDFTVWRKSEETGDVVMSDDSVTITYYTIMDGVKGDTLQKSFDLSSDSDEKLALKLALRGRKVGDTDFEFELSYDEGYKDKALAGKTVTYHVLSVDAVNHMEVRLDFLNASERPMFNSTDVYAITAPRERAGYIPNSSAYMTILESFAELTGRETVAVGLNNEIKEKYGLDKYVVYYESPLSIKTTASSDDVTIAGTIPNWLYISERQQDGTYYVASLLFDIVAKVDASALDFVEWSFSRWVSNAMMAVNIHHIESICFDFNYADAKGRYNFELSTTTKNGNTSVSRVELNGKVTNINNFKNLYVAVLNNYYVGDYSGDEPIQDIISSPDRSVLTMTVVLRDGDSHTFDFYPYSPRRVLVSLDGGAYFYIPSSKVEKMYRDVQSVANGETPDYDKVY